MPNSGFINEETQTSTIEKLDPQGGTSEAFIVKTEGKNLFMKRLRPEFANNPKYRTIFEKEYELGKSLDSPYIPQYISLNQDKDGLYIIMEYIYGDNIEEKLESDPEYFQNEKNIYKLLMQLLKGLEELHSKDILYLDFNPKNIMLTKFGNNVKILPTLDSAQTQHTTTLPAAQRVSLHLKWKRRSLKNLTQGVIFSLWACYCNI